MRQSYVDDRTVRGIKSKYRGFKSVDDAHKGYRLIRAEFQFCEGRHRSNNCPHRAKSTAPSAESLNKHSGFVGVRGGLATGLFATVGTGPAQTASATAHRGMNQRQDEFWVDDSGATEFITQVSAGLEDYVPEPAGHRVEDIG